MKTGFNLLLFIILFSASSFLSAQTTTTSPYSNFGIGLLRSDAYIQGYSMGGANIGRQSALNINKANPASYSSLLLTTFEAGASLDNTLSFTEDQNQYTNNAYLRYLAMGVPISDWWGMSFGLKPYSSIGYNYQESELLNENDTVDFINEGSGGINQFYVGNAFDFEIDSTKSLSLGFNASYLFGNLYFDQRVVYPGDLNYFNVWERTNTRVGDFYFDFGLQYSQQLSEEWTATLGGVYSHEQNLQAHTSKITQTYTGPINLETFKDTAISEIEVPDTVNIPRFIGFGITLEKDDQWIFALDYKTQQWSNSFFRNNGTFKDNYRISAGAQYIPDSKDVTNFWKMARYRLGMRYKKSYLSLNDKDIEDFGITFGLGLPLKKTFSTINFGIEIGQRGTTENNLVLENYGNFTLGLTINDKWFIKRRYE